MKETFQNIGRGILYNGTHKSTYDKYLPYRSVKTVFQYRQAAEYDQGEHYTAAVDRADRSEKKAPVLPVPVLERTKNTFIDPAQEGKENENIEIL